MDNWYEIRSMEEKDIDQVIELRRKLGFCGSVSSLLVSWLKAKPEGFKVAAAKEGKVLGMCYVGTMHQNLCHLGFYAVDEGFRNLGVGMKLWDACKTIVGERDAAVVAKPEMVEKYRTRGGFPIVENNWKVLTYCSQENLNVRRLKGSLPVGMTVQPFKKTFLSAVSKYDFNVVGYDRSSILNLSLEEGNSRTFIALAGDSCVGYGSIRTGCLGHGRVGPLYADDMEIAEALLRKLLSAMSNTTGLMVTVVSNNTLAIDLMEKLCCPYLECGFVMYNRESAMKKVNAVNISKVFVQSNCNFSMF